MSFLDLWQKIKTPARFAGRDLHGVAFGNLTYAAVGPGGFIAISHDGGHNWNEADHKTDVDLHGVTYVHGQFTAVGGKGRVFGSRRGDQWWDEATGVETDLNAVTHGRGMLIAVGDVGTIVIRPEGEGWLRRRSPTQNNLYGVAYGKDRFLAVGEGGTIIESKDGWSWRQITAGLAPQLNGVAYGQDTFLVVGDGGTILTYRDTDGIARRRSGTISDLRGIAYGRGGFVVAGALLHSVDGQDWTLLPNPSKSQLWAVAYGNGQYTVVGQDCTVLQSHPIAPSADLVITRQAPKQAIVGQPLVYTLTVGNLGPSPEPQVTLQDSLGEGASYVSAVPSQGECELEDRKLTCSLGPLPPGEGATVHITVRADAAGSLANAAAVAGTEHDPDLNNNQQAYQTAIAQPAPRRAELAIKPDACTQRVKVGGTLDYQIRVINKGSVPARQVVVGNRLPQGTVLVETTSSQGRAVLPKSGGPNEIYWHLGELAPRREAVVTVKMRTTAKTKGPVNCRFSVSAANGTRQVLNVATKVVP